MEKAERLWYRQEGQQTAEALTEELAGALPVQGPSGQEPVRLQRTRRWRPSGEDAEAGFEIRPRPELAACVESSLDKASTVAMLIRCPSRARDGIVV